MQSPLAETNDPLPPELTRTLAFCRCSSHCGVGSNWYFSFSCLSGGELKSHMPSSALAMRARPNTEAIMIEPIFRGLENAINIAQHKTLTTARQLRGS